MSMEDELRKVCGMADLDITIKCSECGEDLDISQDMTGHYNRQWILCVSPCGKCLNKKYVEGSEEMKKELAPTIDDLSREVDRLKQEIVDRMPEPEKFAICLMHGSGEETIKENI